MRYTVHPLESSDLDAAASLVADRHTKNRFRLPDLSPSFSDPAHCRAALITALEDSRSTSAAAIADGRLAGFAIGATSVSQSDSLLGQIGAARSATVNAHTMGLAEGEAATSVFRSIYRDLSGGWIANGFFDHNV
ncbi:MAG: hypothetical protein QF652_07885, partial [Dehalococcoidia bacterium]|nr:hypothetical protein [Dehalococcoidia bacterium]